MEKTKRPRIRVLPEDLRNRIAAGEVVERPASVVKELLENSLDAGARKVNIEIEGFGKKRILVSDDGSGMDRDDALAAVERHATSKIATTEDLFAIRTLGFRGEALPSIASVSLFTMTTRGEGETGTRLYMEGGKLIREEETGFPRGAEVEVRELFYNTPARKKFLKTDSTELGAISETVYRTALSRPDLRIRYVHNGRELLNVVAVADLHERAASVFGKAVYPKLFPISGERGGLGMTGMISAPDLTRPNPSQMHLFLNGRAIRDRSLRHAVTSAYGNMLEAKRFPIAVVMLDIPVDLVDVNVHPAKSEVRFRDSRLIYRFIRETVREGLGRSPWLGGAGAPSGAVYDSSSLPERVTSAIMEFDRRRAAQSGFKLPGGYGGAGPSQTAYGSQDSTLMQMADGAGGFFSSLTILAQLHKTYILVSAPRGLGIIDQHAAHERVAFERLRKDYGSGRIRRQALLFPIRVDLDPGRLAAFRDNADDIASLGFELEPFGGDSIQLRAVPEILAQADPASTLRDLLDDFSQVGGSNAAGEAVERRLATIACHSAVRAEDRLNYEQMLALLRRMDGIDFAATCPHGRPVFIEISLDELEKRFGRKK